MDLDPQLKNTGSIRIKSMRIRNPAQLSTVQFLQHLSFLMRARLCGWENSAILTETPSLCQAARVREVNPDWSDEDIFQAARRRVIASLQAALWNRNRTGTVGTVTFWLVEPEPEP